jgi:hypothetical protein
MIWSYCSIVAPGKFISTAIAIRVSFVVVVTILVERWVARPDACWRQCLDGSIGNTPQTEEQAREPPRSSAASAA